MKNRKMILIPFAAAALTIAGSMMSFAATGWQEEDGTWRYYNASGDAVTDSWKKSGNDWFWLGEDGDMAVDTIVEDGDNRFYVNEDGAMVKNEWREFANEDGDDDDAESVWYYFGADGKAYRAPSSGKTTFKTIGGNKYAFGEDGKMLYGWVNESSERETGEDAWRTGTYYLGEAGDGVMRAGRWEHLEVEDDSNETDGFDGSYWFYFNSNGKKAADTTKTIGGKKYRFETDGNAVFNWQSAPTSDATASNASQYFNEPDQCWRAEGWFYAVPDESVHAEAYESGDSYWFYANKSGDLVTSQIKKINGNYYGFNEYGEMLSGLYKLSVDGTEITYADKIESADELPEADDSINVYFFGETGVMKTGTASIDLDGDSYSFSFRKTSSDRGAGYEGINSDCIYVEGRMLKAEKDMKYSTAEYDGNEYLINTSGKIQKKKTNVKDGDDMYYCTDASGIVTYYGSEKWTKD